MGGTRRQDLSSVRRRWSNDVWYLEDGYANIILEKSSRTSTDGGVGNRETHRRIVPANPMFLM